MYLQKLMGISENKIHCFWQYICEADFQEQQMRNIYRSSSLSDTDRCLSLSTRKGEKKVNLSSMLQ